MRCASHSFSAWIICCTSRWGRMVDTDVFYKSVKQYLRGHFSDTRKNPLLDKKSRTYLTLLTIAPKTVRRVHGWTMKLRGVG